MAPFASPSPEAVLNMLRAGSPRLPIGMGGPAGPTIGVDVLGGEWCLFRYAFDGEAYASFVEQLRAEGKPLFPEHSMRFLVPGEIVLRRASREAFVDAFAQLTIEFDANYRAVITDRAEPSRPRPWWRRLLGR